MLASCPQRPSLHLLLSYLFFFVQNCYYILFQDYLQFLFHEPPLNPFRCEFKCEQIRMHTFKRCSNWAVWYFSKAPWYPCNRNLIFSFFKLLLGIFYTCNVYVFLSRCLNVSSSATSPSPPVAVSVFAYGCMSCSVWVINSSVSNSAWRTLLCSCLLIVLDCELTGSAVTCAESKTNSVIYKYRKCCFWLVCFILAPVILKS